MLTVKTPEEALALMEDVFPPCPKGEEIPLGAAWGRVLFLPVTAQEFVPGFDRSTVDGFAVRSSDTFGCSDAIPAILTLQGEVTMGAGAGDALLPDHCVAVPTGGHPGGGRRGGDDRVHGGLRRRYHRHLQECGAGSQSDFQGR